MKFFLLSFSLIGFSLCANAQQDFKKIKIILLGTFHFNQSIDSNSKLHSDLFSVKRQDEINDIVSKFVKQKPDKIFLEFTSKNQHYYDSIYAEYLAGKEPATKKTAANEIFQLGMKTAKQLHLQKVYAMNYQPEELENSDYIPANKVDSAMQNLYTAFNTYDDSARTNASFYDLPFPHRFPNGDSLLQKSTLTEFLLYLNLKDKLKRDEYTNWNYLYSMGNANSMSMSDYAGTFWYGTNVKNYNNVLRSVNYKTDNCYLVIYGSSHIPFLTYLFSMNPYFEVMDLDKVLK